MGTFISDLSSLSLDCRTRTLSSEGKVESSGGDRRGDFCRSRFGGGSFYARGRNVCKIYDKNRVRPPNDIFAVKETFYSIFSTGMNLFFCRMVEPTCSIAIR